MPVVAISARPPGLPLVGLIQQSLKSDGKPTSVPVTYINNRFGTVRAVPPEGRPVPITCGLYPTLVTQYAILARQSAQSKNATAADELLNGFAARERQLFTSQEAKCDARWSYFGNAILDYLRVIPVEVRPMLAVQTRDRCLLEMLHLINFSENPPQYESGLRMIVGSAAVHSLLSATYTLEGYAEHPRTREKMYIYGSLGDIQAVQPNNHYVNDPHNPNHHGNPTLLHQVAQLLKDLSYGALVTIQLAAQSIGPRYQYTHQMEVRETAPHHSADRGIRIPESQIPHWRFKGDFETDGSPDMDTLIANIQPDSRHYTELVVLLDIFHHLLVTASSRFSCFSGMRSYPLGVAPKVHDELLAVIDRCAVNEGLQAYDSCCRTESVQGCVSTPVLYRRGLEFQFSRGEIEVGQSPLQMWVTHAPNTFPYRVRTSNGAPAISGDSGLVWALAVLGNAAEHVLKAEIESRDALTTDL